jgi:hypothetical protein
MVTILFVHQSRLLRVPVDVSVDAANDSAILEILSGHVVNMLAMLGWNI